MAATEGRVATPERPWGCRCGTPSLWQKCYLII